DGQTWSDWKSWNMQSSPHLTNAAPVVSAADNGLLRGEAVSASSLFSVSDADGDPIASYQLWDDVNGGGYFTVNGVQQAAGQAIDVSNSDLTNTQYVGAANASTEQVWARANDGIAWGPWKNWLMSTEGGMVRGGLGPDTWNGEAGPTVRAGGDDHVVLKDWYAGKDDVQKLQVILDATPAYDPNSNDPLYNRKVETFDFRGIVSQFDQALAQSPGLTSWAVTNALLQFHLSG